VDNILHEAIVVTYVGVRVNNWFARGGGSAVFTIKIFRHLPGKHSKKGNA